MEPKTSVVRVEAPARAMAEKMINKKKFARKNLTRVISDCIRNEYLRRTNDE